MLRSWEELPAFMQIPEVRPYWEELNKKRTQLRVKRAFDAATALVMLVVFFIPMVGIAVWIKADSRGAVFYRQKRVTAYGRPFYIHKFRTMVSGADKAGPAVTVDHDSRITKAGAVLRRYRLDELPQLIDVLAGTMSFVGTRPEAAEYVEKYRPEYYATLLLPAGITSEASIRYKDEEKLLAQAEDADTAYIEQILPEKMRWNLRSLRRFSLAGDLLTMVRTVTAVFCRSRD